jgi:hypothetical protein
MRHCLILAFLCAGAAAQTPSVPAPALKTDHLADAIQPVADGRPLPDPVALMKDVEANERKFEAIQKEYVFKQHQTYEELDSHEGVKKTKTSESEIFWVNGVPVSRELSRDGKPLTPEEAKKQDDRINAEVKKANDRREKADAEGKETDPRGHDEVTLSRILELGSFHNERRDEVAGRDTIVIDFVGDPHAKVHNPAENLFRELAGTLWIDEKDRVIQHIEGHFDHDLKIGGGLIASVREGTWFKGNFHKINDEVWLPSSIEGAGHLRYLLFFSINGHLQVTFSDYRKFRASAKILPGLSKVDPDAPAPEPSEQPAPKPPPNP